ncbi:MAG: type IV pilin protein [Dokdonella sp.]
MSIAKYKGFTLIELMIVIAIIAIIAAIALPSYARYAFRARRAEGKDLAMRVASQEERYYTNLNRYTPNIVADLGIGSVTSENGYYTVAVVLGATNQTYTIRATPVGIQAGDSCLTLLINNSGSKDWTGTKPPPNGACW